MRDISEFINKIYCGDCLDLMREMPSEKVDLIITSPPYNVGKDYDLYSDVKPLKDYLGWCEIWITECFRILKNGGRICINIANTGRKPYVPLNTRYTEILEKIGFLNRGEIIWNKGASANPSTAWGTYTSAANPVLRDTHEYILVFSKGDYNKGETGESTITGNEFTLFTKSVWSFNAECSQDIDHPAPFPVTLPYRFIQLYSYKDDLIYDPFMGSGSTGLACKIARRRFIGSEISEEYIKIAERRLEKVNNHKIEEWF
jgi:site-specific DNA-methyltransferase (adenine-specific)